MKNGVFPADITRFDGVMIGGSPASARGTAPWISRLLAPIREIEAARQPLFGACFGHQTISLALGGTVGENPGGWTHGRIENTTLDRPAGMTGLPDPFGLFRSHNEQITRLPADARAPMSMPPSTTRKCRPVSSRR